MNCDVNISTVDLAEVINWLLVFKVLDTNTLKNMPSRNLYYTFLMFKDITYIMVLSIVSGWTQMTGCMNNCNGYIQKVLIKQDISSTCRSTDWTKKLKTILILRIEECHFAALIQQILYRWPDIFEYQVLSLILTISASKIKGKIYKLSIKAHEFLSSIFFIQ